MRLAKVHSWQIFLSGIHWRHYTKATNASHQFIRLNMSRSIQVQALFTQHPLMVRKTLNPAKPTNLLTKTFSIQSWATACTHLGYHSSPMNISGKQTPRLLKQFVKRAASYAIKPIHTHTCIAGAISRRLFTALPHNGLRAWIRSHPMAKLACVRLL